MINISNLNAYYGQFHVLEDINITIEKEQVVVVLGPNGHGKSTLLKSICGLAERNVGEITYDGESIVNLSAEKRVDMGITYIAETRAFSQNDCFRKS